MKKLLSSFEADIVQYYDSYFLSKERIEQEVNYIEKIISRNADKLNTNLLDVGCGTGFHDEYFSRFHYIVDGVDISKDMVDYANKNHKKRNVNFYCCDIRLGLPVNNIQYDNVVSLSHVIGYQLDNDSLEKYLMNISMCLKPGGVFFFNFYHQPAFFMNRLSSRCDKKSINNILIQRFSNAVPDPLSNTLNLEYFYIIEDNEIKTFMIEEKMRYFSVLEIEFYLKCCGFGNTKFFNYMTVEELNPHNWNGGCIAQKIL